MGSEEESEESVVGFGADETGEGGGDEESNVGAVVSMEVDVEVVVEDADVVEKSGVEGCFGVAACWDHTCGKR